MARPFKTKRNDTKPFQDLLEKEVTPGVGDFLPINLAGCTVKFFISRLLPSGPVLLFGGTGSTGARPSDGIATYQPTPEQMALAGIPDRDYPLVCGREWEITYPDATIETVPAGRTYLKTIIGLDLG